MFATQQAGYTSSQDFQYKCVILGDSQSNYVYNPGSINTSGTSYNSTTGVVTISATGHGLFNGAYIYFMVLGTPVWNTYATPITFIDSNTFSFVAPTGLTFFTPSVARYGRVGNGYDLSINSWLRTLTKGTLNIVRNAGVTGDLLSGIAARIPTEVLPLLTSGDLVILQGGHNNLLNSVDNTPTGMYNDLVACIKPLVNAGLKVIYINLTPMGDTFGANTATNRALTIDYNRLCAGLPEQYPGVAVVDAYGGAVDASNNTLTGTSGAGTALANYNHTDRLHWSPLMTNMIATKVTTIVNAWYAPRPRLIQTCMDSYDSTSNPTSLNIMQNGGMNVTTGGTVGNSIAGAAPSQFNAATDSGVGASMTSSVQASSWGWAGNSAKITINSGTVIPANSTVRYYTQSQHARIVPNQRFIVRAYCKTTNLAGLVDYFTFPKIFMQVDSGSTYVTLAGHAYINTATAYQPNADFNGFIESEPQIMMAGTAATSLIIELGVVLSGTIGGSNATFEIGQLSIEPYSM